MKQKGLLGLVFLFLLVADTAAYAGRTADFIFTDLDGKKYTPQSLQGKPIVLYIGSHL